MTHMATGHQGAIKIFLRLQSIKEGWVVWKRHQEIICLHNVPESTLQEDFHCKIITSTSFLFAPLDSVSISRTPSSGGRKKNASALGWC